jgi:AcrR family transcriptional regulator
MPIRTSTARRERTRERARRDILESAARVFARRGYAAATLAELAEAAGYAAPSLYRYFGSKEEIYESLLALVLAEIQGVFDAPVDPHLPLQDRLAGLLARLQRVAEGRGEILDLLVAENDPRERQALLEKLLEAWLRKHARRAELRIPAPLAARVAAGILLAHPSPRRQPRPASAVDPFVIADLILHGVSA